MAKNTFVAEVTFNFEHVIVQKLGQSAKFEKSGFTPMIMKRKLTEKLTENVFIRIDIQNDFHSTVHYH